MGAWLGNIDPWLAVLVAYVFALGGIGGWAICQVTHKQRGIEVDRPITDNLPMPPPPVVVPDHVPDGWIDVEWDANVVSGWLITQRSSTSKEVDRWHEG